MEGPESYWHGLEARPPGGGAVLMHLSGPLPNPRVKQITSVA